MTRLCAESVAAVSLKTDRIPPTISKCIGLPAVGLNTLAGDGSFTTASSIPPSREDRLIRNRYLTRSRAHRSTAAKTELHGY